MVTQAAGPPLRCVRLGLFHFAISQWEACLLEHGSSHPTGRFPVGNAIRPLAAYYMVTCVTLWRTIPRYSKGKSYFDLDLRRSSRPSSMAIASSLRPIWLLANF